jgi:hypothetical protein
MGPITIFAAVVIAIFLIVTIAMLSLWQFYKEEFMLGGLVVMWIIVGSFVLVVLIAKYNSRAESPAQSPSQNEIGISSVLKDRPI